MLKFNDRKDFFAKWDKFVSRKKLTKEDKRTIIKMVTDRSANFGSFNPGFFIAVKWRQFINHHMLDLVENVYNEKIITTPISKYFKDEEMCEILENINEWPCEWNTKKAFARGLGMIHIWLSKYGDTQTELKDLAARVVEKQECDCECCDDSCKGSNNKNNDCGSCKEKSCNCK